MMPRTKRVALGLVVAAMILLPMYAAAAVAVNPQPAPNSAKAVPKSLPFPSNPLFQNLFNTIQSSPTASAPLKRVLDMGATFFPAVKSICRTQECTDLAQQGETLVEGAQEEYTNGTLTGAEAHNFLENARTVTIQLINSIKGSLTPAEQQKLKSCKECQNEGLVTPSKSKGSAVGIVYHPKSGAHMVLVQDQCQECTQVASAALQICAVYGIIGCEPCYAICVGTVYEQFLSCQETYCLVS